MEASDLGPAPAPSLADQAPAVFQKYFEHAPRTFLTAHHTQSYEAFVFREMLDIIKAENPITILKEPLDAERGIYKYKTEIFIGGDVADASELAIDVGSPIVVLDGGKTVRRMFPNEARIRNLTYAANFQADILVRTTWTTLDAAGVPTSQTKDIMIPKYRLFNIPILLRSKLCATHGASKELLFEIGECVNDQGGYFIVDGSEKLLITRQEQAFNTVYVAVKSVKDLKINTYASVVCQHPVTKHTRRVALYRLHATSTSEEGVIRVSLPFVKGAIPLFTVFRALGVESDEMIVRMILPDVAAPVTRAMETTLLPSIADGASISTTHHALEFIRTLTKGFVIADVLNILHAHLFAHVPDRPLARAQYLAEIVRKMIRVEMSMEPPTNRDDIRNQRLLPTGTLLRGLFAESWTTWKKTVRLEVDKIYNYNKTLFQDAAFLEIFRGGNANQVLSSSELNASIMRGFRGRWGASEFTIKKGVIQPVARISYLDAMSHTRRVISDFDTSMKLTGPRHLHPSQVGYFCTSETPTGAHIGATKNLSILTAISVAAPTDAVRGWLLSRGGVIEIGAAPTSLRATATSVQINGGTVGFTTDPATLTMVLKMMKWTACLPPTASVSFNTSDNILRIYLDDGRPLRPLWRLGGSPTLADRSWRDLVCGTLPINADKDLASVEFVDPLGSVEGVPTLADYAAALRDHVGSIEYIDPYEGNEAYISWWGRADNLTPQHTHAEIHPSSLMGLLANMIPFANHNQAPRNQLSCSQSKQGIGYYATNYESRFDTYGSMLCYGEGPLCRTITYDAVAGGSMPYGTNLIFALCSFNGYNQDDGILFNRSSIERGMFRSLAFRSYETVEEEDPITHAVYTIANPRNVLAWNDLKPGQDYSALDENGVIREGTVITDRTVLVARYLRNAETGAISDASLMPTVFTKGRVDKVAVLHQANGLRLVRVRILEERVPELGDKFCLTPDHDVLTANRGWVPIVDITLRDNVLIYNHNTQESYYETPLDVLTFEHNSQEELFEIVVAGGISQVVTGNHRLFILDTDDNKQIFMTANELYNTENISRYAIFDKDRNYSNIAVIHAIVGRNKTVHCISCSTGIFYIRHAKTLIESYTGNSSRHGQKGTMGMLLDAVDMPRTADGMVPDIVVNPHCIPSRMTIAQMLEQVFGKYGAQVGAKVNATAFMNDESSYKVIADALQALGMQRDGEEIMYSGITGAMFTSSVFIAPLYFMRLKHLTQDKLNARSNGRREIRTHQPTGGRGNEGGMRIGEMERDVLIAHGITDFLTESMMKRSDGTTFYICNGCGTIPIYNSAQNLYVCPLCDGPLTFAGETSENLALVLPVKKSRTTFSRISMPYALKLLDQELTTYMNGGMRFLTERGARRFREPTELETQEKQEETTLLETLIGAAGAGAPQGGMGVKVAELPIAAGLDAGSEDAPADLEDEGLPARNEGPAPIIPPGGQVIKFSASTPTFKEFSTYHRVALMLDGKAYPTVEHYFQAMKFPDHPEYQETIRVSKTPAQAKRLGKTTEFTGRSDWSTEKDAIMLKALREKFSDRHPKLKQMLLETNEALIQDISPLDNYWGVGKKGTGQNKLGKLLMTVRDELRLQGAGGAGAGAGQVAAVDALMTKAVAEPPAAAPAPGTTTVVIQNGPAPAAPAAPVAPVAPAAPAAPVAPAAAPEAPAQPPAQLSPEAQALPSNDATPTAQVGGGPVIKIHEVDANAQPQITFSNNVPALPTNSLILDSPIIAPTAAPSAAPIITGANAPIPADESQIKVVTITAPESKK
jgi:DNA-directed RNA polymerase II subunit RPB2